MSVQNNKKEKEGLAEMRRLREAFITSNHNQADQLVRDFLQEADDQFMLQFLRGRKYRPDYAFETLKRHAEVKFVKYPEMFPNPLPPEIASVREFPMVTVLRARDSLGRRIICFDTHRWDIKRHSLLELSKYGARLMDLLVLDEDAMKNGIIVIQDCSNLGIKHCAQYSVKTFQQLIAIFWLNVWSGDKGYDALHEIFPREVLPKFLKGDLEYEDAIDPDMLVASE